MRTREEINKAQRERRKENGNLYTNKYEKTKSGFLVRKYRNMESRVRGIQKKKFHLYEGIEILNRDDFYSWANSSEEFHKLFGRWELSDYKRALCPSVDRVNSNLGYTTNNMEWVTHSENSRRGALSKKRLKTD